MTVAVEELFDAVQQRLARFIETSDKDDLMAVAGLRDAQALAAAADRMRGLRAGKARRSVRNMAGWLHVARDAVAPNAADRRLAEELMSDHLPQAEALAAAARRDPEPGAPLPPVEMLMYATHAASLARLDALVAQIRRGVSDPVTVDELRYVMIVSETQQARWERTQNSADLDEAVETVRWVLARTPAEHRWYPNRLSGLGGMLQLRFAVSGELADLDEAVDRTRQAVAAVTPEHEDWAMLQSNLGRNLWLRVQVGAHEGDLDAAYEALSIAVTGDDPASMLAARLGLLQRVILARYLLRGDVNDLESALSTAEQAREMTQQDDHNFYDRVLDLAVVHSEVFKHTGDAEYARSAERLARKIIREMGQERVEYAKARQVLQNLRAADGAGRG